jgi:phospholipase D1/2
VIIVLVAGAIWAWRTGALAEMSVESLREQVAAAGAWGPVMYVAAFTSLQPFGVSAPAFLVVAGLCWEPVQAVALGYAGMMGAAIAAFWLARWLGKEAIQSRMPGWLEKWDDRVSNGGLRAVILVRLLFFTTFYVQMMLAVSKLSFRDYVIGTAVGNLPLLLILVLGADKIATWFMESGAS